MAEIALITKPPFVLDFDNFKAGNSSNKSLRQKVQEAAGSVFDVLRIAGQSAADALWSNARYAGTTFRYIVLRYDGEAHHFPETQQDWTIRGSIWLVAHTIGFIFCSVVTFMQKYRALPSNLLKFAPPEIDISHLTAKKTTIDVSKVPAAVQVSNLLTIFDDINFTDKNAPGFMPEVSRKETIDRYTVTYTVAQLRGHLNTFITHVNGRVAFLGTPPAVLAPQLMKFYKKIEDAVRYNVHKVTKEYDDFMRAHGGNAPKKGHADYQKYQDLLENKARVAIDMAIAGAHCGARYMGDAIDTYLGMQGDTTSRDIQTLHGRLLTALGSKRGEVARVHIDQHLGHDTHGFSSYMANMGGVLGIPGTEDVVEFLTGSSFDRQKYFRLFFRTYTADFIRETVQQEIKTSQSFRETVFDWLKDQVKDWKKQEYQKRVDEIVKASQEATSQNASSHVIKIDQFANLVRELKNKDSFSKKLADGSNFPKMNENWDEFYDALFGCPDAKAYLQELFKSAGTQIDIMRARQQFKAALSKPEFKSGLQEIITRTLQGQSPPLEKLKKCAVIHDKIAAINASLVNAELPTMIEEVLYRCLEKNGKLKTVVQDHVDQLRRAEFLDALTRTSEEEEPAVTVKRDGLKRPLLDWILYANNILTIPAKK